MTKLGLTAPKSTIARPRRPAAAATLQVFWQTKAEPFFDEAKSVTATVTNDGGWKEYTLAVGNKPTWTGEIIKLRVDPILSGDGHDVGLDYVRIQ